MSAVAGPPADWRTVCTVSVMWHSEPARRKSFPLTGSTRDRTVNSVYAPPFPPQKKQYIIIKLGSTRYNGLTNKS